MTILNIYLGSELLFIFQILLHAYNRMVPLLTIGGRIAKGFDFLGYSFEPKGLSIAPKTLANFLERITQLYE